MSIIYKVFPNILRSASSIPLLMRTKNWTLEHFWRACFLGSPQGKFRLTTCHLLLLLYRHTILLKMLRVSIVRLGYIAFRFRGALPTASRFSTTISFAMKVASLSNGWRRHNDSNPSNLRRIERGEAPPNTSAVN